MLNSYKELIVWQKSMELAKEIYFLTKEFPKSEIFGLTSQMRRAAISIPSNIAEGFNRRHKKEFTQFVSVAFGSGAELETQILLSESLKYGKEEDFKKCDALLCEVMKMLNKLIANLNSH
jgi:four helix bundle protein